MFLEEYLKCNKNIKQILKTSGTFEAQYDYYKEYLTERVLRLFKWNCGDDKDLPREIEIALMLGGSVGITDKYKGILSAYQGYYAGQPTQYYDVYKQYAVHSPVYSKVLTIGKDVVVGRNNALMNSVYPLIHNTAMKLAHIDVSFIDVLIDGRTSSVPVAMTEAQKQSLENWRNALCNGKVKSILDPAFSTTKFIDLKGNMNLTIKDLVEVRQNILEDFYNAIGVRCNHEKKGNMIEEEVTSNDSMLLFNINDMLRCRQNLCEEVNKMYGTNWTVDLSDELKQKGVLDDEENDIDAVMETE